MAPDSPSIPHPGSLLRLFTTFRLERDGRVVLRFPGRKEELLLARLALFPRREHRREDIAADLWPENTSLTRRRNRLSEVLYLLRGRLSNAGYLEDAVVSNRMSLQLSPALATDVQLFEEAIASDARVGDPAVSTAALERALALYGEGLLPAISAEWVEPERRRLEAMRDYAAEALRELVAGPVLAGRVWIPSEPTVSESLDRPGGEPPSAMGGEIAPPDGGALADVSWEVGEPISQLSRAHAERMAAMAEEAAAHLRGPERHVWIARLDNSREDIESALDWAIEAERGELAGRIAAAMWRYWQERRLAAPGRHFIARVLALRSGGSSPADARLQHGAGVLALLEGDPATAKSLLARARDIYRRHQDVAGISQVLTSLGIAEDAMERYDEASAAYQESIELKRVLGDDPGLMRALKNAALTAVKRGRLDDAEDFLRERLALADRLGDVQAAAATLAEMGTTAQHREQWELSRSRLTQALDLYVGIADRAGVAFVSRALGYLAYREDDLPRATELFETSRELSRRLKSRRGEGESLRYLAAVKEKEGDDAGAAKLLATARLLLDEAADASGIRRVDEAIRGLEHQTEGAAGTD